MYEVGECARSEEAVACGYCRVDGANFSLRPLLHFVDLCLEMLHIGRVRLFVADIGKSCLLLECTVRGGEDCDLSHLTCGIAGVDHQNVVSAIALYCFAYGAVVVSVEYDVETGNAACYLLAHVFAAVGLVDATAASGMEQSDDDVRLFVHLDVADPLACC